jgi:hypothetical protein
LTLGNTRPGFPKVLNFATSGGARCDIYGDEPADRPPFTWPTQAERDAWLGKLTLSWAPGTSAA